jgi:hypothetical protein
MDDFLKMDIFFGVATGATIIMAALMCVALMYLIRLLRTLSRISEEIEGEAKALRADFDAARMNLKRGGMKVSNLFSFFETTVKRLLGRKPPPKRHKTPTKPAS